MARSLARLQYSNNSEDVDTYITTFINYAKEKMNIADRLTFANQQLTDSEEEFIYQLMEMGLWDRVKDWDFDFTDRSLVLTLFPGDIPELSEPHKAALKQAGFRHVYFGDLGAAARVVLCEDN
jgi:hypothetical protein